MSAKELEANHVDSFLKLLADPPSPESTLFKQWWAGVIAFGAEVPHMATEALRSGGSGYVDGASLVLKTLGYGFEYRGNGKDVQYLVNSPSGDDEVIQPEHPIEPCPAPEEFGGEAKWISLEEAERQFHEMRGKLFIRPRL